MDNNYYAKIIDCTCNLSKKEEVLISFMTDFTSLEKVIESPEDKLLIKNPQMATVKVHNESSENKDYTVYVFFNIKENIFYYTSSPSLAEAYENISDIMEGEEFDIFVHKLPSSNYAGRFFLTCSIALES